MSPGSNFLISHQIGIIEEKVRRSSLGKGHCSR